MRKRSRSKLSLDSNDTVVPYLPMNASQISVPDSAAFYRSYSPTGSLSQPSLKKESRIRKLRVNRTPTHPPNESSGETPFTLDTNLSDMDGIIRSDALAGPSTASISSVLETTPSEPLPPHHFSSSMFSNPFSPSSSLSSKRRTHYFHDFRKISPKTIPTLYQDGLQHSSLDAWTAPESWAVEKDDDNAPMADVHSTSEDETAVPNNSRTSSSWSTSNDVSARKRRDHKSHHPSKQPTPSVMNKSVRVRIYRDDGSYHVAQLQQASMVADLTPLLNAKLLFDQERETHKLYLKERGRG